MFLDQLTSLDGSYLNLWNELKYENYINISTKPPLWFQHLEKHIVIDPDLTRRLHSDWKCPPHSPSEHSLLEINKKLRPKEWIASWLPSNNDVVYGQVCKNYTNKQILLQHWTTTAHTYNVSPSKIHHCY